VSDEENEKGADNAAPHHRILSFDFTQDRLDLLL